MFEIFEENLLVFWVTKFEFWKLWLGSTSWKQDMFLTYQNFKSFGLVIFEITSPAQKMFPKKRI